MLDHTEGNDRSRLQYEEHTERRLLVTARDLQEQLEAARSHQREETLPPQLQEPLDALTADLATAIELMHALLAERPKSEAVA